MQKPNYVIVMTDTQGANVIGAYGRGAEMGTPHLDHLATQSVRFDRAYTTTPVCGPARAGLFTGQYAHSSGTWANELPLTQTVKTMGQRFRDQGYRTVYIGKWHLSGQDYFDTGVCPDGWDEQYWYDGRRYLAELSESEITLWRGLSTTDAILEADIAPEFTWGHRISQRAIQFLEARAKESEQPFLLVLSYDEPHGPCACPRSYVERYKDFVWDAGPSRQADLNHKPALQQQMAKAYAGWLTPEGRLAYPPYFACNSFVDHEIGTVLAAVDRFAPPETFCIFTSDHGDHMGAHGLCGKGMTMYDEHCRIPLLIRQPGGLGAGTVNETLVSHIDLLPTLLELSGLEVPPILDGQSLVPVLQGRGTDRAKSVVLEWNRADADAHGSGAFFPIRCLVAGDYKLAINLFDTDEFYDRRSDPHEMQNRIGDESLASVRDALHDHLLLWMNQHRDPFRGPVWANRPWRHSPHPLDYDAGQVVRPADGYLPPIFDYSTGQPVR